MFDGKLIAQAPLVAQEAVEEGGFFKRLWHDLLMWCGDECAFGQSRARLPVSRHLRVVGDGCGGQTVGTDLPQHLLAAGIDVLHEDVTWRHSANGSVGADFLPRQLA